MKRILVMLFICLTTFGYGQCGNWYFRGLVGLDIVEDPKSDGITMVIDRGVALSGAGGYQFFRCARLEAECTYRANGFNRFKFDDFEIPLNGRLHTWTFMANGLIDFALVKECWAIYLGGGIGGCIENGSVSTNQIMTEDGPTVFTQHIRNNGFVYQGIAGMSFHIHYSLDLDFEYRFLNGKNCLAHQTIGLCLRKTF